MCLYRFLVSPYHVLSRYGIRGPTPLPIVGNLLSIRKVGDFFCRVVFFCVHVAREIHLTRNIHPAHTHSLRRSTREGIVGRSSRKPPRRTPTECAGRALRACACAYAYLRWLARVPRPGKYVLVRSVKRMRKIFRKISVK